MDRENRNNTRLRVDSAEDAAIASYRKYLDCCREQRWRNAGKKSKLVTQQNLN